MADIVTIYNLALSHIGEAASVVSPTEGSEIADACQAFYPSAKAKMLELHDWSFASRSQVLAELSLMDTMGWLAGYAVPSGCLRMQYIKEICPHKALPNLLMREWPFEIRYDGTRQVLYTDCPAPIAGYIADVSEGYFTPAFTDALAWLLASYVAGQRIKGQEGVTIAQTCERQYQASLSHAKTLDGHNLQSPRRVNLGSFIPQWIRGR